MKFHIPPLALLFATASLFAQAPNATQTKPLMTFDSFLAATDYTSARISPDGTEAVVATNVPDWMANRFRGDLWLWRASGKALEPLTESGHDSGPEWSPDGRWIAFTSDRLLAGEKPADDGAAGKDDPPGRIWIVSANGGEARPLYRTKDDAHCFAWAPDSSAIYIAIQEPLSKNQTDEKERDWKDVTRYRTDDRGDVLLRVPVPPALSSAPLANAPSPPPAADQQLLPEGATAIARSLLAIDAIRVEPHAGTIAFVTNSVTHRLENPADVEIYSVAPTGGPVARLTNNQGLESNLRWSPDGQRLYFTVQGAAGSVEGPYRDVQGRIYWISPQGGAPHRVGADFDGNWQDYTILPDGSLLATGMRGTSTQVYRVDGDHATKLPGVAGSYGALDAARHGDALLLTHSAITEPTEVYVVRAGDFAQAQQLTHFNQRYLSFAQPEWRPYTWKADDGATVEGVLIYPPDKRNAKHLPMLTLIHGGPADADGDHFGADWYDWAAMAAAQGWLVFRPNYRGSAGYGDQFMQQITPHIVSRPGKDILEGVDALVADGSADPERLVVGGYSYGGYMTDWLITQTTRFRAAVTGAGAIEHAANWGNDDLTYDDASYLNGRPWENPAIYQSEAALFQMNKITTPTHIIAGDADIRVAFLEDILLEHALQSLGIPHALVTFPGEGHSLSKNPWHGYIGLREELKWIDQYGNHTPPAR